MEIQLPFVLYKQVHSNNMCKIDVQFINMDIVLEIIPARSVELHIDNLLIVFQ